MADKPILFSGPMVKALLAGTKTQTRRAIRSARVFATPESKAFTLKGADLARALQNASRFRRLDGNGWFWEADAFDYQLSDRTGWMAHIGYAPGDRLYVREAWRVSKKLDGYAPAHSKTGGPVLTPRSMTVMFEAGGSIANQQSGRWEPDNGYPGTPLPPWAGKFRQGMHLPRWASRITLNVTDVRVERLQDISEGDALAEGIVQHGRFFGLEGADWDEADLSAVAAYRRLWTSINGAGSWEANPWVACYGFTVALGNIDQLARAA